MAISCHSVITQMMFLIVCEQEHLQKYDIFILAWLNWFNSSTN